MTSIPRTCPIALAAVLSAVACAGPALDLEPAPLEVLSSAPYQVTGGDARIAIWAAPEAREGLDLLLNDEPVDLSTFADNGGRLEGVIEGLEEGENHLQLLGQEGTGGNYALTLVNHPITGPVFSGPHQDPFVCTVTSELGIEPLVDSDQPPGFAVMGDDGETVIGYSRNCHIEPYITYFYRTTEGAWEAWPDDGSVPADLAMTTTIEGEEVEFVARVERGTINRFIYSYAMLVDPASIPEEAGAFDTSRWNGRLMYRFQGGVGIGHTQGRWAMGNALDANALALGHAIAYSTGTRTGEHYNLQVGGETALMTKEHFVQRFGEPLYTVGWGSSGGAIQQYVYGQNHPGLLDAAIPGLSYPDMVTQTIHIGDCELLEYYMDTTEVGPETWEVAENRTWLVGLNATHIPGVIEDPFYEEKRAMGLNSARGMSECIPAWRGLTPLSLNPHFGSARNSERWEPRSDIEAIEWTHTDDLRNIYGVGDDGFARRAVDNVGVQYGLRAFVRGDITTEQFLDVNARVGGWKPSAEMVQEGFPFLGDPTPDNFDPWSSRNMMLSEGGEPAPRHEGDLEAIQALYESGMVFQGEIHIPVLDIRPWLEPILDMHNSHQSFAARQRILDQMGRADHHAVWFAGLGEDLSRPTFPFERQAFLVMDEWMQNLLRDPEGGPAPARPQSAADACFTQAGDVIAQGEGVWAGILDDGPAGPCTETFPIYAQSRIEAGGPITGDIFKCQLKSVDDALADGTYGERTFTDAEEARLREIFPDGVCDYSLPDAGRP